MKTIQMLFVCLFLLIAKGVYAQRDSIKLDLIQAERLFITNNYDLIASNYQIDQAKAEIITAKLFDNPQLTYENLFYNHETKRFFETSMENGQYNGQISQLFKLAGKRNKNIKLAQTGVKLAEFEYFDLIRTLRFQLRNTFYKAYFSSQTVQVYEQQIASGKQLLKAYEQQLALGNVAAKDVIRIKSLMISLKSELSNLLNDLEDNYKDLKILCGIPAGQQLHLVDASLNVNGLQIGKIPYASLLDSAQNNRADLKLAKASLLYNETNLKLQKAMGVPDVEVSLSYDLKGSAPNKYTGLGIKIPLPLFDRNQGEIKKARIGIDAAISNIKKYQSLLENEVYNSYKTALRIEQQCAEIDPKFSTDFDLLLAGLIKNFRSRNVSLIEFIDLYDAYKESTIQLNNLQYQRMSTREEINYVTGSNIFK